MIRSTAGAELCATASNPNPRVNDCVEANDKTHKGIIPLSGNVVIGEPVQKSPTLWSVPYDVVDEAGNSAETVWRDVQVEEVDIATLETTIRREMQEQMEAEKEEAVRRAVAAERKKKGTVASRDSNVAKSTCECPPCTAEVSTSQETSNEGDRYCEPSSRVIQTLLWLENFMSPSFAQTSLLIFVLFGTYLVLNVFWATLLGPQTRRQRDTDFDAHSEERARALQQQIGFLPNDQLSASKPLAHAGSIFDQQERYQSTPSSVPRIPRTSVYLNGDSHQDSTSLNGTAHSFTSPYQNGNMHTVQPPPSAGSFADEFYDTPSKITPSKRGDGVHRRSPFQSADRGGY